MVFWAVITACCVGFLAYRIWQRYDHFQMFKKIGVPGPPPSLFWGNIIEIYFKGHLTSIRRWHRQYGPIFGYYFGYEPVLVIANPKHLKSILIRDFANFTDRPEISVGRGGKSLTVLRGQRWRDVRAILTPAFSSTKLKQLSPEVGGVVDEFMNNVHKAFSSGGRSVDMYELYQALTLEMICRCALGMNYGIQKDVANSKILQRVKLFFASLNLNLVSVFVLAFPSTRDNITMLLSRLRLMLTKNHENPIQKLSQECAHILKLRRNGTRRLDFLQLMIDAQVADTVKHNDLNSLIDDDEAEPDGEKRGKATEDKCPLKIKSKLLTDEDISKNALLVLLAGYVTTSFAFAFITRLLVRFPEVQERLREALIETTQDGTRFDFEQLQRCQYLDAVIQESLRMYPPVYHFTSRETLAEKIYDGLTIPKGMAVFASTCELHYNPDIFPDPETFRPDRFLPENRTADMAFAWQPFGAGPRTCFGMSFALMEIKVALAKLLTQYRLVGEIYDPIGDANVNYSAFAGMQTIHDPLLVTLERLGC